MITIVRAMKEKFKGQVFPGFRNSLQLSGITLMELIVVIIIIGVLAGTMISSYTRSRERAYDKQAKAILMLIRGAERTYWVEKGEYRVWPGSGATSLAAINSNLSLDLADDGNWGAYIIKVHPEGFYASVGRTKAGYKRYWFITAESENATCGGLKCP